jgi:hypothetical protein
MSQMILPAALHAWIRGLLTYALLTLPALFIWPMYAVSIMLATIWSLPALLLFGLMLYLLHRIPMEHSSIMPVLLLATACITAACTWGAAWQWTGGINTAQQYAEYMLFPIVGILSAMLAVMVRRRHLMVLLAHSSISNQA